MRKKRPEKNLTRLFCPVRSPCTTPSSRMPVRDNGGMNGRNSPQAGSGIRAAPSELLLRTPAQIWLAAAIQKTFNTPIGEIPAITNWNARTGLLLPLRCVSLIQAFFSDESRFIGSTFAPSSCPPAKANRSRIVGGSSSSRMETKPYLP